MDFKRALSKRVELEHLLIKKKLEPNHNAMFNIATLKGGVNKKYNPARHEVITMKNSARQDYIKEDKVHDIIQNFNFTPDYINSKKNFNKLFFSFQEAIDSDLNKSKSLTEIYPGRDSKDIRRVSVYTDMYQNNDFQYMKFKYSDDDNSDIKAMNLEQISFCIHQLIYAHFVLFESRIMHGDLHMNNIKWLPCKSEIDNQLFAILKIFDFGHAKFNCYGIHGGSRFNDLQYLFELKSQKTGIIGYFEGKSRNHELKKMYQSNDQLATSRMAKHYPILFFLSLVRRNKNLKTLQEDISILKMIGGKLESNLRKSRKANKKQVLTIFEDTSNEIVKKLEILAQKY